MSWPLPVPVWFWVWARWYLGRAEYKGHARELRLRPRSAPATIPGWAWERLRALLAAERPTPRERVVSWARWGVEHEALIHYSMSSTRDDWLGLKAGTLPMTTDCSGFATACYDWAGLPDPNGLGYKKLGYTGTLLDHAKAAGELFTEVWRALPGDLIVYGTGTGQHVAVIVESGSNPLTVSHGVEAGPQLMRVSQDGRKPQRICRYITG